MNHNLETVPRLYRQARPGCRLPAFARLAARFQGAYPAITTKSGLMVGLGETDEEILEVMRDLREHDVDMLTVGQYLRPRPRHLPVLRYVEPTRFKLFRARRAWVSCMRRAARWCARAITLMSRRTTQACSRQVGRQGPTFSERRPPPTFVRCRNSPVSGQWTPRGQEQSHLHGARHGRSLSSRTGLFSGWPRLGRAHMPALA